MSHFLRSRGAVVALATALAAPASAQQADHAPSAPAAPGAAAVRARLAARHRSRAAWMHEALKLRPGQEADWRAMVGVLAPDNPSPSAREAVIRRFYDGLDADQQRTFTRMVAWAAPRSAPPARSP